MLEGRRRNLLESMGLKILQPRFQLAAAKSSSVLRAESFHGEDVQPTPVIPDVRVDVGIATTRVVEVEVTAGSSLLFEGNTFDAVVKTAAQKNLSHTPVKAIRYRHRLVRVGEILMLLDQPSLEWQDGEHSKVFFSDIYFSLVGKKFEYWSDAQFDWPPVKNFPYANDEIIAQQSLQAFLFEHVQQPPCKWIVLWGHGVTHSLLGKTLAAGEMEFLSNLPVLVAENYQDYWRDPMKKQILWQQLQVVKKSLAGNA